MCVIIKYSVTKYTHGSKTQQVSGPVLIEEEEELKPH